MALTRDFKETMAGAESIWQSKTPKPTLLTGEIPRRSRVTAMTTLAAAGAFND